MPRPVPDPQQDSLIEAIRRAVAANGDARHALTGNLVATVAAIIRAFTGWYDDLAVQRLAKQVADVVTPAQRVMASQEDAYLSQVASTMSGRIVRPVGPVDVSDLRTGVPADQVYARLAEQYRWERSVGTGEDDALAKILTRAGVMNTTDVALAARSQAQSFFEEHKVTGYRRVLHPELSKGGSCGLCIAASDRIYHRDQLLPLHARCIPGNTAVSAIGVQAVTRRLYSGAVVVLTTASGQQVAITPNHPILTDQGWVPADFVNIGDDVVSSAAGQWAVGGGPDEQHGPTSVEQIWRALTVDHGLHASSVPLAAEDFHGDGLDGEVDVVFVDRLLPDIGHVSFAQPPHHAGLVSGGLDWAQLSSLSRLTELVGVGGQSTHGFVGSARDLLSFLAGGAEISSGSSFGQSTPGNLVFSQDASDYITIDTVMGSQFGLRNPRHVVVDDLHLGQVVTPETTRFDPAGFEFAGEGRRAYAELGRNLRNRLAAGVCADRIVEKRLVQGSHYVYNLHTVGGWYSAANYIVSNCACGVMPIVGSFDAGNSLNNLDLSDLYNAAGSTSAADLKKTRWQVNEHGELGPVLAPAGAEDRLAA